MKRLFFWMLLIYGTSYSNGPGDGKNLFDSKCAKCHGKDGTKGSFGAKNLQKSRLSDTEYAKIISEGKAFMPSWKKRLSGEQIIQVIQYIKELKNKKMKTTDIILLITTTFSALIAGLFYAYTCSVNLGLGKLSDIEYIKAMQSINREIQNPIFFSCFFGTLILIPLCAFLQYNQQATFKAWILLTAALTYAIGVFGVTAFGNVPLNNALENFNLINAANEAIQHQRSLFEAKWNSLNTIRTVFSIITVILLIIACMNNNKTALTTA